MDISISCGHSLKVYDLMNFIGDGMFISCKEVHFLNAQKSITLIEEKMHSIP